MAEETHPVAVFVRLVRNPQATDPGRNASIFVRALDGESAAAIARDHGITRGRVQDIINAQKNRIRWAHPRGVLAGSSDWWLTLVPTGTVCDKCEVKIDGVYAYFHSEDKEERRGLCLRCAREEDVADLCKPSLAYREHVAGRPLRRG